MNIKDIFAQNNLVIQKEEYTCGPTSLLNVLCLKGELSYTELEVAKLCDSNLKDGTTHEGLIKGAKAIGLEVIEHKENAAIKDIERNIDAGGYVIVNYFNAFTGFGHYAVVTEYDDLALYLRDCFYGLFRMEKRIFKKWWYGKDGIQKWYVAVR